MGSLHSLTPNATASRCVTCREHSDLQGPLIQWAVLALDPVTGSSLQTWVQGTGKDGAILMQALWCWVLGAREDLWTEGQLYGPKQSRQPSDLKQALKMG